jgi:hypothetical protein
MALTRTVFILIAVTSFTLQGCDLFSKAVNQTPTVDKSKAQPTPVETLDDPSLPKILKVALALPQEVTFTETNEYQGDFKIVKVTKSGKTKDGYLIQEDSVIKKWNADKAMEYYRVFQKGRLFILTVPKFK